MEKLKLGTIGTSWITDSFIQAALDTEMYELACVYSRTIKSGEGFSQKYGTIPVETDLNTFLNRGDLDVVYIASPNSLHYEQALLALKAKKHVMVEKPASINTKQWDEMIETAKENDVFIIEAIRHMFIPNIETIIESKNTLGEIQGATMAYAKYSSKYDSVLAGEEPNIFSLDFAGGALMDLGIYPIYTAVTLFGEPTEVLYFARKIKTGVDISGTIILRYENFDVTILVGKNITSTHEMEIYGENQTLIVNHASDIENARIVDAKNLTEQSLDLVEQHENDMYYEAKEFAQMIDNKDSTEVKDQYSELTEKSRVVSDLLNKLRKQENIVFSYE